MSENTQNTQADLSIDALDDLFGTDTALEKEGAWMDIPVKEGATPMRIRLRSQGAVGVRNLAQKIQKRHRALYAANRTPTAEQQDEDAVELLARGVVTGWEGFPLAFNETNVRAVMQKYPALRDLCNRWSSEIENYQSATKQAIEGN